MSDQPDRRDQWRVIAASIRGSAHANSGQANQDAVAWRPLPFDGLVVAVSDGHGSEHSPRSERGSRFAVEEACRAAEVAFSVAGSDEDVASVLRSSVLPVVVERWRSAVQTDLRSDPLISDTDDSLLLYGATLLVVVVTRAGVAAAQIGDGDIVVVRDSGNSEHLIRPDDRFVAGETPSLCLDDPLSYARVASLSGPAPGLLVLATDGYGNSFADEHWVGAVGPDLLEHLRSKGMDWVQERLGDWLADSARVAGDDVTVALLAPPPGLSLQSALTPAAGAPRSAPAPAPVLVAAQPSRRRGRSTRSLFLALGLAVLGLVAGFVLGRITAPEEVPAVQTPSTDVATTAPDDQDKSTTESPGIPASPSSPSIVPGPSPIRHPARPVPEIQYALPVPGNPTRGTGSVYGMFQVGDRR